MFSFLFYKRAYNLIFFLRFSNHIGYHIYNQLYESYQKQHKYKWKIFKYLEIIWKWSLFLVRKSKLKKKILAPFLCYLQWCLHKDCVKFTSFDFSSIINLNSIFPFLYVKIEWWSDVLIFWAIISHLILHLILVLCCGLRSSNF